jgi:hypothetical protein
LSVEGVPLGVILSLLSMAAGLPGALFPERTIRTGARLGLGPLYENADQLAPREWYIRAVRLQSLGLLLSGLIGFLLATREGAAVDEAAEAAADETFEAAANE